jgi:hypothetical protein
MKAGGEEFVSLIIPSNLDQIRPNNNQKIRKTSEIVLM